MSLIETPDYLDVVADVATTPYTVADLRNQVPLKWIWLLDDSLVEWSAPYIALPKRKLTLDLQGQLVFSGSNTNTPKLIDESLSYDADTLHNTLDRELVIVLKWRDDSFTTTSSDIKTLRNIIMRLAVDEKMRTFIREHLLEAKTLLQEIDDAQKSNFCPPGLEARAKRFYKGLPQLSVSFSE
jgi:hypothetical protein